MAVSCCFVFQEDNAGVAAQVRRRSQNSQARDYAAGLGRRKCPLLPDSARS